jgi:hypothetical protein
VTDEERLEKVARELCRAAGENPDAKIRMGQPISFTVGDCTILKPLIVPAWKAYSREARRLSMADTEHMVVGQEEGDEGTREHSSALHRAHRPARMVRIVMRRRWRRLRLTRRLAALSTVLQRGPSAWTRGSARKLQPVGAEIASSDRDRRSPAPYIAL